MSRETCRCGRPMIGRSGEMTPTCGECRSLPSACDCEPLDRDREPIDITDEAEAVREITRAIKDHAIPSVYVRGHQLVHVVSDEDGIVTSDIDHDLLRSLMADHHLACVRKVGANERLVGALPYPATCKAILARVRWPRVPALRGVVSYPVMLGDGAILQRPGYHAPSGLFLHGGADMEPVPAEPSTEDIAAAKKFLMEEYLTDFPWVSDADKANYLAILMTPLLREVIAGLFPFVDLTAPERGSGKTLLALFLQALYGASTRTLPKDDAEMRKAITASLRGSSPVIIFDNIPEYSTISSPSLAAVLTLPTWTDRILGQSRDGTWPNDRLWCATGTNIRLGGDFAQRSVLTRIDYGRPRPDLRTGFKIENIDLWTAENRGTIIRALLILARSWHTAGAPAGALAMRGFTRWARVLGGILGHHEIPGFMENREQIAAHDDDAEAWSHFLAMLRGHYGIRAKTAREILEDAAAWKELGDAFPPTRDGGPHTTKTLGNALSAHEGRWYGDLAVRRTGEKQRAALWQVQTADACKVCGERMDQVLTAAGETTHPGCAEAGQCAALRACGRMPAKLTKLT